MIAVTTASRIDGYHITAYKGTAQGASFEELLKSAETLGANALLITCYDDGLDVDTLFHGATMVIELTPDISRQNLPGRDENLPHSTHWESRS